MTSSPKRKRAFSPSIQEGTLRFHPRGFGFVTNPDGKDRFVPPTAIKELLDGDTVTYKDRGDDATDLTLVARSRTDVMCDAVSTTSLRVDSAIGNLVIKAPRKLRQGSAYLVRLEPFAIVSEFRTPLSPDAIAARVFVRHGIPETLPTPALSERPSKSTIARRDLRSMLTITIDDDSSEDLDDALSCQLAPRGDLRVFVHIADVAAAVAPRSAIDRAASQVPTSVYLPDRVRHMLPRQLASDSLSLIPNKDRFALTVEMLITQEGTCRAVDIFPSTINSNQRLSYQTAAQIINAESTDVSSDIDELVSLLHQAASRISIARNARGGVNAWRVDSQESHGNTVNEEPAHELIERLMVMTNELVAEFLHSRNLPAVFRTHPELTAEQVADLSEKLPDVHVAHPLTPTAFAALALAHRNTRDEPAFWDAALSVMPKASYQLDPAGHFGLGSSLYAHFTSPLRRYADLLTHRVLHAWFRGERHVDDTFMRRSCVTINEVSRAADAAERDARQLRALADLTISSVHEVVVLGSKNRDARVRFTETGLQTFLPRGGYLHAGRKIQVRVVACDPLTQHLQIDAVSVPASWDPTTSRTTSNQRQTNSKTRAKASNPTGKPAPKAKGTPAESAPSKSSSVKPSSEKKSPKAPARKNAAPAADSAPAVAEKRRRPRRKKTSDQ
jgi:ribonuclease R